MSLRLAAQAAEYGSDQWLEFAARLHPVFLHFPIGLLAAAVVLELASAFSAKAAGARRTVHVLVGVSAVVAAASGWLLGREDAYDSELIDLHRLLGIAAAALALVVALVDLIGRSSTASTARRILLIGCFGLVMYAGHLGGIVTHGRTFVSDKAPPFVAELLDAMDPSPPASDLAGELLPMEPEGSTPSNAHLVIAALRSRCIECHGPDKMKGALRLDELDGLMSVIAPGDPTGSELFARVILPSTDDRAMPPSGARLSPEAITAIEAWIAGGAPLSSTENELARQAEQSSAALALLERVRVESGARIEPLAIDRGRPVLEQRLEVDWSRTGVDPSLEEFEALQPLAHRVVALHLGGRVIANPGWLPQLPRLTSANLARSELTNANVRQLLRRAPALAELNLHSTEVSGEVMGALLEAPSLERVVLFDTWFSADELASLAERRPGLDVQGAGRLPADPFSARPPRRILAADSSTGRIALLREVAFGQTQLLWEHRIEALHDLQWLGSTTGEHGRVLFQESWTRLVEVDTATGEVLWSYDAASTAEAPIEIHSFQRLDDRTTLIAESGPARLTFVNVEGAVQRTIPLTVDRPHVHHDTRLVRPTPTGTYLVAHERDGVVREYDDEGDVVWTYDVPLMDRAPAPGHGPNAHGDQVFGALRLADGDTLVTTGNGSSLLRVRPNGSLRWHLGQNDLFDVRLGWTTSIQALSNGNLVLGNCHAGPDQPQAIELTPDGELVWTFRDHDLFGNDLSNLLVIEAAP